jgi:hypothetical protein
VEEARGRLSFGNVRCGRRLAVRFRVRAVLGPRVTTERRLMIPTTMITASDTRPAT